jgi:glycosyltransferase involved in cell wall biosynthesis
MPNKIKVLFIGEMISSHAQGWVSLFTEDVDFEIYILDIGPESDRSGLANSDIHLRTSKIRSMLLLDVLPRRVIRKIERLLMNNFIARVRPHIIHTFGLFPVSEYYVKNRKYKKAYFWVAQARGGPDIALNMNIPKRARILKLIFERCDFLQADNDLNYDYAVRLGLSPNKKSPIGSIPGSGGIDISSFKDVRSPSKKERVILWPKAYTCIQSDGLVVIEAIRRALPDVGDFRLVVTATTPEVDYWIRDLLRDYLPKLEIRPRTDRTAMLGLFRRARVLLAPSLSDGIPNVLYEAMASNVVPIVSPLDSLKPMFTDGENVLYARNLDPEELAKAIRLAMKDDEIADRIAYNNRTLVEHLADKNVIRQMVVQFYRQCARSVVVKQ